MSTFHIDANGNLLRQTTDPDAVIPGTVTKTEIAPQSGKQHWHGTGWDPLPLILPEDTPLTPEDIERLLLSLPSITQAIIDAAKRDRGKP